MSETPAENTKTNVAPSQSTATQNPTSNVSNETPTEANVKASQSTDSQKPTSNVSNETPAAHTTPTNVAAPQSPATHTAPQSPATHTAPQSPATQNRSSKVSDMKTVKVSNISLTSSKMDIMEFFSFSGDIQHVEMQRESEKTQLAYVTFKDSQGADTAICLSGATIANLTVTITPVDNYMLPPDAMPLDSEKNSPPPGKKAEDVVSTMLAKGFVLGKDAVNKAKAFDEQHKLSSNASAKVVSIDKKIGLSEKISTGAAAVNVKAREMDERFQVSEKTKSAYQVAEQKASTAGTAIMSNRYVMTGATWVTNAFSAVAKTAEDVGMKTKEKVEQAEKERQAQMIKEKGSAESPSAPSPSKSGDKKIEKEKSFKECPASPSPRKPSDGSPAAQSPSKSGDSKLEKERSVKESGNSHPDGSPAAPTPSKSGDTKPESK